MAADSSLSLAAVGLRNRLIALTKTSEPEVQVIIAYPQAAVDQQKHGPYKDQDHLSLFLYRVELGAHPADGGSDDPLYLRAHCLVTALGASTTTGGSPGERELRLIGAVMAGLQAHPILDLERTVQDEEGHTLTERVAQIQVVPANLSLDDINHLWATQGSVAYRLSVAYELALLPVPLGEHQARSPRVGAIAVQVQPNPEPPTLPEDGPKIRWAAPRAPRIQVDVSRPDWNPHLCLLNEADVAVYAMLVTLPAEGKDVTVKVITLGPTGAKLSLHWEIWQREPDADRVWRPKALGGEIEAKGSALDPDAPAAVLAQLAVAVKLPLSKPGQALLTATRTWEAPGRGEVVLASNRLLVTVS